MKMFTSDYVSASLSVSMVAWWSNIFRIQHSRRLQIADVICRHFAIIFVKMTSNVVKMTINNVSLFLGIIISVIFSFYCDC